MQLLIFTFVIAMSLVVITIATGKFPEIPNGVWALLGISGGSYVVSKGIQSKSEEEENRIKQAKSDGSQNQNKKPNG